MSFDPERMPVLVGAGQTVDRRDPEEAATPIDLMCEVARMAAEDSGAGEALLDSIDTLVAIGLTVDAPEAKNMAGGMFRNPPRTVSKRLGISPQKEFYSTTGGNTPQMLVNHFAEQIAAGDAGTVLITGAEALHTMINRMKRGLELDEWQDDPGSDPQLIGINKAPSTEHEKSFGLHTPSITYPLFENALRGKYGLSLQEHRKKLGELYASFNQVAANNPLAWFPIARTAEEIAEPSESNRYVGFPYTKYLNSIIQVNLGAALIMTTVAKARELGVAEDKMVYLHGCGDANDIWFINERADFHSSPAMRRMGEEAMAMAGKTVDDMDFFDIYSCFPSAVEIACDEFGIAHDDPRGLTVTGGLPYFGGPGNNYVTHSIASMMAAVRAKPGSFGLLNANGWFITKHSIGIYSTTPPETDWQRKNPADYQDEILDQQHPPFTETPQGRGCIETYTVLHNRQGVERAIVIGLLDDGTRFIAETPDDPELLETMKEREMLGVSGNVEQVDGRNRFIPEL